MRNIKTAVNIILTLLLLFAIVAAIPLSRDSAKEPVKSPLGNGILKDAQVSYENSLIRTFPKDTSWKVGGDGNKNVLGTSQQPKIQGHAAVLINADTGEILYEKKLNKKLPIASLTKIMTAIVALEHKELESKIYVTRDAAEIGENTMGIDNGEVYTLHELMYGLILHSGNDAAYAIAEGVAGDSDVFVEWMNIKAAEIGLYDTVFADPSGLDDKNVSTAADLAKLTKYAMQNPDFREVVGTIEIELFGDEHKYLYLYNQTNLLSSYPGVAGVKTGYTEAAGLCLVTYAQNNGVEVIGVILNSSDRKGDMILMLDQGFGVMGVDVEHDLL